MTGTVGFDNGVIVAKNISFDYTAKAPRAGQFTSNGQILIGSEADPNIAAVANTITPGPGITITNGPGTIEISSSGGPSSVSFAVQGGASPVVPTNAGSITFNGAVVAAGTNPIQTFGSGANTMVLNLQTSQAISSTNATNIGLSAYNSSQFTVDSNGFVSIKGSTTTPPTMAFDVNNSVSPGTNPVVPSSTGVITIEASAVSANSVPIQTISRGINAFNIEVQESAAVASSNASMSGISHFNSAQFTVDSNGFVSTSSTGPALTLTGNTGSAVSPSAGNINTKATGSITIVGNPATNTLTTQLTGLTNHAVLVGAGTATITNVGPSSVTGQILQSQGSSADPAFSTATYPSTATGSGTILISNGTNWVGSTATYPNTVTTNQILFASGTNTITGLAPANQSVLTSTTAGVPTWTSLATNGALIIGSSSGNPTAATLTAGTGITITNGANSITISSSGGSTTTFNGNSGSATGSTISLLGRSGSSTVASGTTITVYSPPYQDQVSSTTITLNSGSFATAAITLTLPASSGLISGDLFEFVCTTSSTLTIRAVGTQQIRVGSLISSAGGTIASTKIGDSVSLRFRSTDGFFYATSIIGTWIVS